MSDTLYRRELNEAVVNVFSARKALLSTPSYPAKSATSNDPIYVRVVGKCNTCNGGGSYQLPKDNTTYNAEYISHGKIKPPPKVDSVFIEYGGDHGLVTAVTVKITCFTLDDFNTIQKYFLMPGNELDIKFGYHPNQWGIDSSGEINGMRVATFSFATDDSGIWTCTTTALSPSKGIEMVDAQHTICNGCDGTQGHTSGPLIYKTGAVYEGTKTHQVIGVDQLIASDAQKNGEVAIDELKDGEVITSFKDYSGGKYANKAHIIVYDSKHTLSNSGRVGRSIASFFSFMKPRYGSDEVNESNNIVYVSMAYIVDRIVNNQLLKAFGANVITKDNSKFKELSIGFHEDYSFSQLPPGVPSGDPNSVLILDSTLGKYKNSEGDGKDFWEDCKDKGRGKATVGNKIDIAKILINRDIIIGAMAAATNTRIPKSENPDVKDQEEEVINIMEFFKKVFDVVNGCTGGGIALRLVENPDDNKQLIVVDQNYGDTPKLKCLKLDPIDGDNNTRTCVISSDVGSREYKAYMYSGGSRKGDPAAGLRNCIPQVKSKRNSEYGKAILDINGLLFSPGSLGKNNFSATDIDALKAAVSRAVKNNPKFAEQEPLRYPGLSVSATLSGIWGFLPYNAIRTTQMSTSWPKECYFMVTKVSHEISPNDWITMLDGILGYHPNIQEVP